MLARKGLLIVAALLLAPVAARAQTAVASPSLLSTLTDRSTIVIRVPAMKALLGKLESSPLWKVTEKNEFAQLMTDFRREIENMRQEALSEAKVDPVAMLEAVHGEVVVSLGDLGPVLRLVGDAMMNMEEPNIRSGNVPLTFAFDTAGGFPVFKENLQSLLAFAVRQGARIKTDAFHGGKLTTLSPPEGEGDGFDGFFIAEHGTKFLVGLNKQSVEQSMVALGGTAPDAPLLGSSAFQTTHKLVGEGGDLFAFINLRPVLDGVNTLMQDNPFGGIWVTVRDILFGKSLENMGMGYFVESTGLRGKAFVHNHGAEDGLLSWFRADAFAASAPAMIPTESKLYASLGFNAPNVERTVRQIFSLAQSFGATPGGDLDSEFENNLGVKFSDLIRSIGNRVHMFSTGTPTEDNPAGDMSMALELKSEDAISTVLARMAEQGLESKSYMNRDLYTVDEGPVSPTLCVTDKTLLFSLQRTSVEQVVRRLGKDVVSLSAAPAFQAAASAVPKSVHMLSFASKEYNELASEGFEQLANTPGFDEVPPELFKLYGAMMSQFGDSVGYAVWQEAGYFAESSAPFRKVD